MKLYLTLALNLLISSYFLSQQYLGVSTSNYAGSMGTQLQPASFVDGRFVFDLNIVGLNNSTYQNFGYFDAKAMRSAQGNGGYWWKKSFGDNIIYDAWASPDSIPKLIYSILTFTLIPKSLLGYLGGCVRLQTSTTWIQNWQYLRKMA